MNDRFWELLAKYWAGSISDKEKVELEQLMLEHPDSWLKHGLIHQIKWNMQKQFSAGQADRLADSILNRKTTGQLQETRRVQWYKKHSFIGWAAAVLLILAGSSLFFLFYRHHGPAQEMVWQQVKTTDGMKTTMRLADGSELWLNAASSLRYPENFNDSIREVYLEGEAYFKVKHNPSKPFIIHTADMDIRVLGTELDVRAYKDEDFSETSLINGAVEVVVNQNKQQRIYLKPKQKIVIKETGIKINNDNSDQPESKKNNNAPDTVFRNVQLEPVRMMKDDLIQETAWKDNTLLFEDEPLASLSKRLERWYGVHIVISDSSLLQQRFTGRADNVSLTTLLHILQMIKPFYYSIQGKEVIIK